MITDSEDETTITPVAPESIDLSAELARTVPKQAGDRVRVTRVWGDHYRCNWIAPQPQPVERSKSRIASLTLETYRVRQSRFLKVTRAEDGKLQITDLTADRIRVN